VDHVVPGGTAVSSITVPNVP